MSWKPAPRSSNRAGCATLTRLERRLPIEGVIAELCIREKVEYLRCQDGFELRPDWLTGVDDKELTSYY